MNYPILVFLCCFSVHFCIGSPDSTTPFLDPTAPRDSVLPPPGKSTGSLSALKTVRVGLDFPKKPAGSHFASLFRHFEVIDERPDTCRVGVYAGASSRSNQLVLPRPVSQEIAAYLDARFSNPQATHTALIVLRTLWMSDANNNFEDLMQDDDKVQERGKIHLKAEIYAANEGFYIPIFRFDSLQIMKNNPFYRSGDYLSDLLDALADSAVSLMAVKAGEGKKIPLSAILEFNQSRSNNPICKEPSPAKGVYLTFEEFRDNTPSVFDCETKKGKAGLLLYLKEDDGRFIYSHTAWGYCDGKTIYIMKEGVLLPAWKEGKAWYFFGKVIIGNPKNTGSYSTGPMMHSSPMVGAGTMAMTGAMTGAMNGPSPKQHIFTVDMDNGKTY